MASSRARRAALVTGLTSLLGARSASAGVRALLALALLAICVGTSGEARAQLELRWEAPAGCPDREQVLEKIRAIAGPALDESEGLSVEATITRQAKRSRLELIVRDQGRLERRIITSDSCAALAGATAVTLALLLGVGEPPPEQPDADQQTAAEPNASESTERASASASDPLRSEAGERDDRARARRPSARTAAKRSWAFVVRGPFVTADVGPLPRPALGVGLGLGLRFGAWALSISGHMSRDQIIDGTLVLVESSGAELDRSTGQIALCRGWRGPHFELSPCLGLALELVSARGIGEGVSGRSRRAVWPAPGLSAVAHWHILETFALFATVGGYLELSRPRFIIQELGEVERLGPASMGGAFGVEWFL
jgi:hypothetical protein